MDVTFSASSYQRGDCIFPTNSNWPQFIAAMRLMRCSTSLEYPILIRPRSASRRKYKHLRAGRLRFSFRELAANNPASKDTTGAICRRDSRSIPECEANQQVLLAESAVLCERKVPRVFQRYPLRATSPRSRLRPPPTPSRRVPTACQRNKKNRGSKTTGRYPREPPSQ
jgi:hypothetical protein